MLAFEQENDFGEVVIDVFVSDSDLVGVAKTVPIEKLTDRIGIMRGMKCLGFTRTLVSDSTCAFSKTGYLLRCQNEIRSLNTPMDVRRNVEVVLEAIINNY